MKQALLRSFLFLSIFLSFFSCQKAVLWQDPHSGFSMELPADFKLVEEGKQSWDWANDQLLLSITVIPHTQIEATDEALQLLLNAQLKNLGLNQAKEVYLLRNRNFEGLVGAETLIEWEENQNKGASRVVVADNRKNQVQIRITGGAISQLETKKIEKMLETLACQLPLSE